MTDGADIGDHHVDLAAIGCDLGVEPVEVLELADVALYAGDVPADRGDRLVQFFLTAGGNRDGVPFCGEPLIPWPSQFPVAAGNQSALTVYIWPCCLLYRLC